jgi:hypothetical protein
MEDLDASHTDAPCQDVVKYPIILEKSNYHNGDRKNSAECVTLSHHFVYWLSQFFDKIQALIETQEQKEQREDNSKVFDKGKSLPKIAISEESERKNESDANSTKDEKGFPFENISQRTLFDSNRPNMRVHRHSDDDG